MRTEKEIMERYKKAEDLTGTQKGDLICCLPFKKAKKYLPKEFIKLFKKGERTWDDKMTDDVIKKQIKEYLPFAWEKANNCRGLSAQKTFAHFKTWLWLLGYDLDKNMIEYTYYGKPHLREISEHFGIKWQKLDNGIWKNNEEDPGLKPDGVGRINLFN